jgi:addiction module HigA family antidote
MMKFPRQPELTVSWNADLKPFVWIATVETVPENLWRCRRTLEKIQRRHLSESQETHQNSCIVISHYFAGTKQPEDTMPKTESKTKSATAPVHPGEILLEEFMKPLAISINGLALALRVPTTRISAIVNEERAITADTALRLGRYFSTTSEFWMNLQRDFDLRVASNLSSKEIEQAVQPRTAA